MTKSTHSRYAWGPIRSNRHKTNKRRDVSEEHLRNRYQLLRLDLLDISRDFDLHGHRVSLRAIALEMAVIEDELQLRANARPKKPRTPEKVATFEDGGLDELAELAALWDEEPDA